MNLNHLRIFRAVFEHGSITAAAAALRVSQPAVSKQLAELESSLGTPLVDRLPRGIRLTAAGELLAEHVRRLFSEEEAAERALAEFLGLRDGRLAIGASTTVGSYLVPEVLGEFCRARPGIALNVEIGNTHTIQSWVLDGRLDVGLTEGFVESETLEVEVFTHDEMVLITQPDGYFRGVERLTAAELGTVPFIVREAGSGTRDIVEAAMASRGAMLRVAMSLGSTEAVKNAVASGLGVAIVSRLAVELELAIGRLRELPVTDLSLRRALHCLTLHGKHQSPATTEFLRMLRARYRSPSSAERHEPRRSS